MDKFVNNKFYHLLVALCAVLIFAPAGSKAQRVYDVDPQFSAVDNANYDSLLNSFYIKKTVKSLGHHYLREASSSALAFDNIPDSVLMARLRALPTIVPMTYNGDVRSYIRMYASKMSVRIDVTLALSEYYFPMFEEVLNRYGVPDELKYLTIVESAMNPQATSRMGAAGLWQFMYSTGKSYDLELNSLVDERRDPYRSTVAAAKYLRDLHGIFGDWTLAIAAYNCGPGNINKAIARSGGKRDFWQLYDYLPRETRGYIPAFIAATYIMNYYHEHGIKPNKIEVPIHTDTVTVQHDMLFSVVQRFTGIEVAELRALNPQFRTDMVPSSAGRYAICLPLNKLQTFIRMEDSIYAVSKDSISKRTQYNVVQRETIRVVHKVKKGETMSKVASRYGVSQADIKKWNRKKSNTLQVGEKLVIYKRNPNYVAPKPQKPATEQTDNPVTTSEADSIVTISADREAVVQSVVQGEPERGQTTQQQSAANKNKVYTVKKGDNLYSIARANGLTVAELKKINNLKSDNLQVGQKLVVR